MGYFLSTKWVKIMETLFGIVCLPQTTVAFFSRAGETIAEAFSQGLCILVPPLQRPCWAHKTSAAAISCTGRNN
jgi:hypothetical protein